MTTLVVGRSPLMKELQRKVESVAGSDLPVLIEGEDGTGKQSLAEHIHRTSRKRGELRPLYCALPDADALDFNPFLATDLAARGTLLLKHVGRLPQSVQERLLAAIQAGLGAENSPWRLLSTSVEPLEQLLARGQFSPELYFRLAVCKLRLPPLRDRKTDLPELFRVMAMRAGCTSRPAPSERLLRALAEYSWPGNLRELHNFAKSYAVFPDEHQIIHDLESRTRLLNLRPADDPGALSLREQVRRASRQLESEIILKALERHRWNRRRAAQTLRISYRALLYKMKGCNLRTDRGLAAD
jgi:DNA-binding NtrC family response regulator